jgi:hypothetical protein
MWTLILAIADPTNPHTFGPVLVMEPDAMGGNGRFIKQIEASTQQTTML